MKRITLWIDETIDAQAIRTIMERYGCESESAAWRLAVRVMAASPMLAIQPAPRPTHARRSPKLTAIGENDDAEK